MNETWRAIPGFPHYEASDLGRIRSLDRIARSGRGMPERLHKGRVLKTPPNASGYPHTQLGRAKSATVHELVLLAFVGPRGPGQHGCHGDGNKLNNALSNLRWDSVRGNHFDKKRHGTDSVGERNGAARLTEADIICIHGATGPYVKIAADYGVSAHYVSHIKRGRTWKHLGLPPIENTSRRGAANFNAKLTPEQVESIRADARAMVRIAEAYGVGRRTISSIKSGKSWRTVTQPQCSRQ